MPHPGAEREGVLQRQVSVRSFPSAHCCLQFSVARALVFADELLLVDVAGTRYRYPGSREIVEGLQYGQRVLYIPGRTVYHAAGSYQGEGKTDAKDAFVIAYQARMRRDLQILRRGDEIAVDLRILTSRRLDLAADRTRAINRMRAQVLEYFPPWNAPSTTRPPRPRYSPRTGGRPLCP